MMAVCRQNPSCCRFISLRAPGTYHVDDLKKF